MLLSKTARSARRWATAIVVPSFEPTHVQGWLYQGNNSLVIGANTAIYRFDGTNVTNVSSQTYSNSPRWQSAQIGAGVVMNNGTEVPEFMSPNV